MNMIDLNEKSSQGLMGIVAQRFKPWLGMPTSHIFSVPGTEPCLSFDATSC